VQTQSSSTGKTALTANAVVLDIAAPQTSKVNDVFRVEVQVSNAVNMADAVLVLEYDPVLTDFVGAEEGTFLKKDGKATSFNARANSNKALITFGLGRVGDVGGISGSGSLAVITFKAKAKGVVNLKFKGASISTPGGGNPVEVNLPSKTIEIK
jgi:general secretion pathway protein D